MSLISAFKTAWQDLKKGLTTVDTYLATNAATIQSDIQTGVGVAETLVPSAAPIITAFDSIEEAAMAEIMAAIHSGAAVVNATTGTAAVTLSAGLTSSVKALATTLAGAPAVLAAAK
jgi:hypothetical protein